MKTTVPARLFLSLGLVCMPTLASTSFAEGNTVNEKISNALKGDWGQIKANIRYSYEHVEQEGLQTANGDPIRLRLGYQTPKFSGLQAYGEFLGNTSVFLDDYNSTLNGKSEYATIGDPNEGALNQAWLSFDGLANTMIKAGRQKLVWDNERFLCPASFRQMEQTMDSVTLQNTSLGNFSVKAAYVWNILTTNNEEVNMEAPLLNLRYDITGIGSVIGYGYWLDYSDPDDSGPFEYAYSSQSYGLSLNGSPAITENLKLLYTAEYASQSEYGDNPKDFTTDYYHLYGGLLAPGKDSLLKQISGKIGYEVFGSDNGVSFQTPLGANHRFNGWADLFGKTKPANGLRDMYGTLGCSIAGFNVDMAYHDFQADTGGSDYGTEFDIKMTKKLAENYTLFASWSTYNADEFKNDVDKVWLRITVNF